MRIALVSQFAPPQAAIASQRVLRMTRVLLAAGHDVHWVTLDAEKVPKVDDSLRAWIPENVQVHALGGPTAYSLPEASSLLGKVWRTLAFELPKRWPLFDGHFEWTARLKRRLPAIVRDHALDAVLLCCGPHGQIATLAGLRRRFPNLRLFVDYRDLLSGNPWNERANPRLRERLARREKRALANADTLFLNTNTARERFEQVMGPFDSLELEVMRNAADYDLGEKICATPAAIDLGPGAHIGFFGTLFPQRRLSEVFDAMKELPPERLGDITLHCFTDQRQSPPILDEDLAAAGVAVAARVVRHEFLAYEEAIRTMRSMHALVLVNSPDERDSVFVPGKLYDYLMARRPIAFVGWPGDASQIVEACGGAAFAYGDHAGLARQLDAWCGSDRISLDANPEYDAPTTFEPLLSRLN